MRFRMAFAIMGLIMSPALNTSAAMQEVDILAIFAKAVAEGRTGIARKTQPVDARPAVLGEVVTTIIKGEGIETRSKPAEVGDFVIRNRCPETGNEQYLVKAATFPGRYADPKLPADPTGWREVHPTGRELSFFVLGDEGPYTFRAPWGETMIARPGDIIVQDPSNQADTYRVARASFGCTYEVIRSPPK
jgi:hypothetical protein